MLTRRHLSAALLLAGTAWGGDAPAATCGGKLVFGRAIESQYLDPTRTSQNADIWISLNVYDTLLQPTADGTGVQPSPCPAPLTATTWPSNRRVMPAAPAAGHPTAAVQPRPRGSA
jgi:ABC-type oligopeptide transport system substrate-binding subunit